MCSRPPTLQYRPNEWEFTWRSRHVFSVQEDHTRNWTRGCALMALKPETIRAWLAFSQQRRPTSSSTNAPPVPSAEAERALSFHAVLDACTGETRSLIPIEPLVGFLRHPEAHCHLVRFPRASPWPRLSSKAYLLPAWHTEVWPHGRASAFLFDLGASLYNKGSGGASTKWFVDEYRARGIPFDRIYAWEATPHTDADIYGAMPDAIVDRIAYYNVPVDAAVGSKHNPWRTLRAVATPSDFVLVKIDIDNSTVEEALIAELLEDRALAGLVDELYFEHHVLHTPMWGYGWRFLTKTNHTLADSYDLFGRLREMGIRAHSWV
jgi:hypothetical protein